GRQVVASPELTAAFDAGVDGLIERLRADSGGDATKFVRSFDEFVEQFGSRGPNEWEMRSPTWGTDHHLALAAIDRMRKAPEASAPQRHWDSYSAERQQLTEAAGEQLAGDPEVQGQFLAAVRAAGIFLAGRERSKTTVIKWLHEMRLRARELGRRMAERGVFDDLLDFGMLTASEWDRLIDDPGAFDRSLLAERYALFNRLQTLEPPFIIDGKIPPLEEWPVRGASSVDQVGSGVVLTGIAGCPGTHTGRARVILDPDEPGDLEPGDILVAPITDPSWTPLFVPAGAVVVDVGAQISHAVIVSRELGIPCVVSVLEATRKIPNGAMLTVDGTAGTVTVH
ncbi:MAG: rifampicin phosphotransferase, partial [Acidimicrobiaceae bacterium]|nr:rifampicin phosphotransferase [Acidimicrobiaceae bacterium]